MGKRLFVVLSVAFIASAFSVQAGIRLPSTIGSHMVLQQNSATVLWGWSEPSEKIFITTSWNNKVDSVTATGDAKWRISIPTPAAGGPYTITLRGWNTIVLEDILVGEVWFCSGQSNMEWSSYQNLEQINEELPKSANNNIRLFHVPKTTSEYPQDNCPGEWKVCGPESLKGFSAVGYFFGKKLQSTLNVPVGIINASWGGTPAETWTPAEIVKTDATLAAAAAKQQKVPWWPEGAGSAYNGMVAPWAHHNIAGVLWYQGESNTGTASTYQQLFSGMIKGWRKAWQKEFPFYFVQIAPFKYGDNNIGALLREQQTRTLSLPRTGMVVITDLVDNINDIHPKDKLTVGLRLADMALNENYGKKEFHAGYPMLQKMEKDKDKLLLYFTNAEGGLLLRNGTKATDFYVAGADKVFHPADVKIEKDRLVLKSKNVKDPVAVRFAFDNVAMPNIRNSAGLPVVPFRTDDWEVNTDKIN